jgi:hypothetical protein
MGTWKSRRRDVLKDQVEQSNSRRRGDEAVSPSLHKRRVVEFVLRANKSVHKSSPGGSR